MDYVRNNYGRWIGNAVLAALAGKVEILKKEKMRNRSAGLGTLIADLPGTVTTPELRIDCPDDLKLAVVDRVKQIFQGQNDIPIKPRSIIDIDGIRAIFENG